MHPISRRTALKGVIASASGLVGACGGGGSPLQTATEGPPPPPANPSTGLTLSGPSTGKEREETSAFTVALTPLGSTVSGSLAVTPTDFGSGGTFAPTAITLTTASPSATFSYTPAIPGVVSISVTNNGALNNPAPLSITVAPAEIPPIALAFDPATPEQISIYCPLQRSVAAGTKVNVRYRSIAGGSWRDAHPLLHIVPAWVTLGSPIPVVDAFAGAIFDLRPGASYDVELTVLEPGKPALVLAGTRATRALPPDAGAVTVTATPGSNLQTIVNSLKAGDVLELEDGLYELATGGTLQLTLAGTPEQPIYIRGYSRDGVILRDRSGQVIQVLRASNAIIENLTIEGSGVDGNVAAASSGILFHNGSGVQANITIRNVTFRGVDKGIKAYSRIDGCLVYECVFEGNNNWSMAYTTNPDSGQPNLTWNDDGITLPGQGNAAWNNTLIGFGDSFAVADGVSSVAVYYWRNRIEMGGDDAFEGDYAARNIGFYDNYCANTATFLSLDPLWGGPLYCFRNIAINTIRGPFKWTDQNTGQLIYNNTILRTNGSNDGGWTQANNGTQRGWSFRNNLLVYRGSSANVIHLNMGAGDLDMTHNAWFPHRAFNWPATGGNFASLEAARAGLPPMSPLFGTLQRHEQDILIDSNPWDQVITLGADHKTEYKDFQIPALAAGSGARGTGTVIPGITDGHAGAAPDRGAVITGRPVPLYGATLPPLWVSSATAGTWVQVPMAATLSDVDPIKSALFNPRFPDTPEWAANQLRQGQIVGAWCGAAYDEGSDTMWLGMGGGHGDYAGNEIYRCSFFDDAPGWQMVRPPSGAVGNPVITNDLQEASGVYSDGRPRAVHTYNKWVYVPGVGPVLAGHGASTAWRASGGKRWSLFFDETSGEAEFTAEATQFSAVHTDGLGACYDPTRHAIWIIPGNTNSVVRYDIPSRAAPSSGEFTSVGPAESRYGFASGCYLAGHDCLLIGSSDFAATIGFWLVFDCATGKYYRPNFVGTQRIGATHGSSQPRWVPRLGAACVWNNRDNTSEITLLTPGSDPRTDPWTISTLPVAPANAVVPTPRAANGTFNRFAYSPRLGGFLVFNSTSGPTYFYKL
jgi:hypothetical protein